MNRYGTQGKPYGPWTIVDSHQVYRDPWLQLTKDDVLQPDGQPGTYSVVKLKPGVCVLAVQDDRVYLTEEFHYAVGRTTLEAVSGGREDGEPALCCAQRELAEEIGIQAGTWKELGRVDPFTASVLSPTVLFVATDLTFCEASPDGTEQIRCVSMSLQQAYQAVCQGQITHAPTCIAILRYWCDARDTALPEK